MKEEEEGKGKETGPGVGGEDEGRRREKGGERVCREDRRGPCHLSGSPCLIREFNFWLRSE